MAEVFDTTEIRRQADKLDIQADNLDAYSNKVIIELHSIYNIVLSSDRENIQKWVSVDEYANTFIAILNKASQSYHELAKEMRKWAEETELEEKRAAGKIGRLNEDITKITSMLDLVLNRVR